LRDDISAVAIGQVICLVVNSSWNGEWISVEKVNWSIESIPSTNYTTSYTLHATDYTTHYINYTTRYKQHYRLHATNYTTDWIIL